MFNRLPRSIWFFVFTGVVFLLQTSPFPGLWLLFLLAPFWSVVTINLGFLSLGIEALVGKTHKAWLIAPLAWFLGYGYVAWSSHAAMPALQEQFESYNRDRRLTFDPTKQSLVIDSTTIAQALLEGYGLPVVYAPDLGSQLVAWHVTRSESCQEVRRKLIGSDEPIRAQPLQLKPLGYLNPVYLENTCLYSTSDQPPTPAIRYSIAQSQEIRSGYLQYRLVTAILRDADGRTNNLRSAQATPYRWLPGPVIGCFLNSAAPSWDCFAEFLRESPVWVGARMPADVAAEALGLKPTAPFTLDDAEQRRIDSTTNTLKAFNDFLVYSSQPITAFDLKYLSGHPDLYSARASEIVTAIASTLEVPLPKLEIAAGLGELLAGLPDAQFAAIAPRLLEIYAHAPQLNMDVIWDHMASRLGDLGEPALPVLDRLAFEHKEPWSRPIYAICRVGVPAARDGERIAEHLRGTLRSDDEHLAAFKTLLRLGRADLLADEPDAQSQYRSDDYKLWRSTISPSSPSEACTDRR